MSAPDLTVVLTLHDETVLAGPALRAADLAVATARDRGFTVQPVLALDEPAAATYDFVHRPVLDHWEKRPAGTLGEGRHVTLLRAEHLLGESWLAAGLARLAAGERLVVRPEVTVDFDADCRVTVNLDQGSPLFTPHLLYAAGLGDVPALAPRAAYDEVPYDGDDLAWTVATLAAGWQHRTVRDTVVFRRRHPTPPAPRRPVRDLPALAIDRVRALGR